MTGEIRRLGLDASFAAVGNETQVENALCPICQDFIEDPKETDCEARHVFCGPCIQKEFDRRLNEGLDQQCPTCRGYCSKLQRPQPLVRNFIDQVKWKCLNFANGSGCSFTGTKKQLEKHLDEECAEQETECPFDGCAEKMKREPLAAHKGVCKYRLIPCVRCNDQVRFNAKSAHFKVCRKVPVSCPNRCGKKPMRGELSEHRRTECLEETVECPVSGCGEKMKRKLAEQHEDESMKKHFKLLHHHVGDLERQLQFAQLSQLHHPGGGMSTYHSSLADTLDLTVRLTDYETTSAGFERGEWLDSLPFDFQGYRFYVSVYPRGDAASSDGNAAFYLTNADDYKGSLTISVRVSGMVDRREFSVDFSNALSPSRSWGMKDFHPAESLLNAARVGSEGALDLLIQLSAPRTNRRSLVVSGYA
uniref:RING-type domain-containing protein n=1 Tax=Chromera velia CCMP2878 TaxID=1169474 RepID=A0A0G4I9Q8_9ALVE|mmetsp:Transcript_55507/g.108687  ORF Transcript_55507/g.108687 Transcript_55507/m.108687 type:complete len:419 (-) Transcript_55507:77-1333(-)|eukprot:Cvel_12215.t1-p1 / transcript=Cvel_12215.t1 / gene=Cvel_12215 / organism=Chromera_velia_CCMP2878 / gene_product=TNF receptor-associated factor 5, putative / transcript_product=TNF receptor-associated factor 5, putative / location=Cvel_scaffold790:26700-28756(+) / protein_length=418 / sequence_SO=supercontig / SO=protein_coding / is_pseudo=false